MEQAVKKKRNNSLDFWRLWCTLCVALMHFHEAGDATYGAGFLADWYEEHGIPPFYYGGLILVFFLIIGGYLMMEGFQSKKRKGITAMMTPAELSWQYSAGRFKGLWPSILCGSVLGWIIRCGAAGFTFKEYIDAFFMNIWDFTGLVELGATGQPASLGGKTQWSFFELNVGQVINFNYPLWYLSAMIITGGILYYLLAKDEQTYKCIWAPLFIIMFYGAVGYTPDILSSREFCINGIPFNLVAALGGMCIGNLVWYLVDYIKKKEITHKVRVGLTIANAVCSAFIVFGCVTNYFQKITGGMYQEAVYLPFIVVIMVCNFINQDAVTKLLDQPIFGKLGEYSLYFFVCTYPMNYLTAWVGPKFNPTGNLYIYYAFFFSGCIIFGIIAMLISKHLLQPMLGKFFAEIEAKGKKPMPAKEPVAAAAETK